MVYYFILLTISKHFGNLPSQMAAAKAKPYSERLSLKERFLGGRGGSI